MIRVKISIRTVSFHIIDWITKQKNQSSIGVRMKQTKKWKYVNSFLSKSFKWYVIASLFFGSIDNIIIHNKYWLEI